MSVEKASLKLSAAAAKVVDAFRRHGDGRLDKSQSEYQLKRQEYSEVLDYLEQDLSLKGWVDRKLRYNYDPRTGLLEICMHTQIHEYLTQTVVSEIYKCIRQFSTQPTVPFALLTLLKTITPGGCNDVISVDDPLHNQSPDAQFTRMGDCFPGVVIETGYLQKAKNIGKKADEYIMMSNGGIRMVIGFDAVYRSNNQGFDIVSIWRPQRGQDQKGRFFRTECILNRKPFRNAKTKTPINSDYALIIPLDAFVDPYILRAYSIPSSDHTTAIVTIPFATLARYLTEAEIFQMHCSTGWRPVVPEEEKRRRPSTPPETSTTEDENTWMMEERRREKAEEEDETYEEKSSSSSE
ncbi:hypothetical protein GP486_002790 [Trichoglossum hirsutum]|uniref:Restriction endonuclease n=1 Tax=Trichoglossum hirsutum TaxID=265104 RepID=A0A9P8RRD8_9PEZI|nr:hypothetical protein GP486_002790 [Trichoglossum hirsutum]